MICEYCLNEHDGSYGSGRFCNSSCAHGFTTQAKRQEINKKVSKALKGRQGWNSNGFKKGFDIRRKNSWSEDARNKRKNSIKETYEQLYANKTFNELKTKHQIKRRILEEQNGKCNKCKLSEWLGQPMKFELEHKNGNNKDDSRENLEVLCPNCHSFTKWWRVSYKK